MRNLFSGMVLAVLVLSPGLSALAAGSASMSLDQSTYDVARGDLFDVIVSLDPQGEALDTARAVVTFDPTLIRAQSVRLVGAFDRSAPGNYRDNVSGKVSWGAFTLDGPVSSQTNLLSITFLALQTGNGSIKISADSRAIEDGEERINTSALGEASVRVEEAQEAEPGVALLVLESSSHENEVNWYANDQVALSWTQLEGESPIEAYYYSFGLEADEEPSIYLDGSVDTLDLEAPEDGLYYFRLKGVQEDGRQTPIARRLVQVDTTAPNPIELIAEDDKINEGESVWFTFATTDETSGVLEYQIAINNSEFQLQTSPLEMEDLPAGTYFFRVAALDRAGNAIYGGLSVRVYPEGTDLSRPDGYDETSEVEAIQSALIESAKDETRDSKLLITVVLGALILFGIIYSSRKRRNK
jgi:hypothetical protein